MSLRSTLSNFAFFFFLNMHDACEGNALDWYWVTIQPPLNIDSVRRTNSTVQAVRGNTASSMLTTKLCWLRPQRSGDPSALGVDAPPPPCLSFIISLWGRVSKSVSERGVIVDRVKIKLMQAEANRLVSTPLRSIHLHLGIIIIIIIIFCCSCYCCCCLVSPLLIWPWLCLILLQRLQLGLLHVVFFLKRLFRQKWQNKWRWHQVQVVPASSTME